MSSLLPGYRFYPTEPELVLFYLRNKLEERRPDMERFIPVVDVYRYHPTELPRISGEASVQDPEQWFFFCPRQEKEAHGGRPTRMTQSGYWKATGSPSHVIHNNRIIGRKKTMVFYEGRAPNGRKTPWKMNEYRAYEEPSNSGGALKLRSEFSLCRVYKKSGSQRSFDRRPTVATARANVGDVLWSVSMDDTPPCHGSATVAAAAAAEAAKAEMEQSHSSSPSDERDPAVEGVDWGILEDVDWGWGCACDKDLS